ncbi:MAG TPA: energy transducer TonB, partial [Bryobacteraceae bacterium]|nr:energy transducer TonB [Bryobacteraceae bacterium]
MFDQFVEDNTARTRRPQAVALSFTGQVALVALTVLFPLLRTEAIVPGRLSGVVTAPMPRGVTIILEKASSARPSDKTGLRIFTTPVLRQPSHVPTRILIDSDAPSVSQLGAGPAPYGVLEGVVGASSADVAQAPRIAPPKPVERQSAPAIPLQVRIGGKVQAAKLISQVTPVYPPLARQARISGIVRLEAVIGRDGRIKSLHVAGGHPLLVHAAIEAVEKWVYQPTLLNGEPVE